MLVDNVFSSKDWSDTEGRDVGDWNLSKILAEQDLWEMAKNSKMEVVSCVPGLIKSCLLTMYSAQKPCRIRMGGT